MRFNNIRRETKERIAVANGNWIIKLPQRQIHLSGGFRSELHFYTTSKQNELAMSLRRFPRIPKEQACTFALIPLFYSALQHLSRSELGNVSASALLVSVLSRFFHSVKFETCRFIVAVLVLIFHCYIIAKYDVKIIICRWYLFIYDHVYVQCLK